MSNKNAHCSYCGAAFPAHQRFPQRCGSCSRITYLNPTPVSVLVLPVEDGVLTIRRGIEPKKGELALPGGFMDLDETWQEACSRELREETGIVVDPTVITVLAVHSVREGMVLVFGRAPRVDGSLLRAFKPTEEATELVVIKEPTSLAFRTHTLVVTEFFSKRG